ncbi:hypothetical protein S2M10_07010 [Sphingomonas sp. S2M10]|uniref:hypothetical protein n=1 Tax=Sphingomonas sp. S2M10 TaxID=2705010 RepID=UPI0014569BB7|nr:hypothetical protein [Sphingomonas sp. S2M10]NLS25731.1 hypothetical protein [Sphingomonas sp. S2M10]
MAEIVVTPQGREAINVGTLIDDDGAKFVCLAFERPNDSRAIITFTPDLFHDLVTHMADVSRRLREEGF